MGFEVWKVVLCGIKFRAHNLDARLQLPASLCTMVLNTCHLRPGYSAAQRLAVQLMAVPSTGALCSAQLTCVLIPDRPYHQKSTDGGAAQCGSWTKVKHN